MSERWGRSPVAATSTFFALTLLLSLGIGLLIAASTRGVLPIALPASLAALVLVTPAGVALLLTAVTEGWNGVRSLLAPMGAWRVPVRWYLVALFLPGALNLASIGVYVLLGGPRPTIPATVPGDLAPLGTGSVAVTVVSLAAFFLFASVSEEIGWRGYALPHLQSQTSAFASSLVVGVVWAIWHVPSVVLLDETTMAAIPFVWYLPSVLAISVLFTWLYNNANGSLLLATALHASIQATNLLLPILPAETGDVRLYVVSVLVTVVVAIVVVGTAGPRELSRGRSRVRR